MTPKGRRPVWQGRVSAGGCALDAALQTLVLALAAPALPWLSHQEGPEGGGHGEDGLSPPTGPGNVGLSCEETRSLQGPREERSAAVPA